MATQEFSASAHPSTEAHDHHDQDERPHVCNDGWITIGQMVVDPETGEETEEYALYLCRKCARSEAKGVESTAEVGVSYRVSRPSTMGG